MTAKKIIVSVVKEKLTTPTPKNSEDADMSSQNDEDEGEILSDEEDMEMGVANSGSMKPSVR